MLELADPFLADAKLLAQSLEGVAVVAQPALPDDHLFARVQLADRLGEPARAGRAVAQSDNDVFRAGPGLRFYFIFFLSLYLNRFLFLLIATYTK